ncbi:GntR family transcriptional regulator [Kribbella antibiotica]|uniref:GntR family transcriptional regulator n=1 Tax=Kribbella antibiotica TaxID=190195 RepID=A0A4R4ZN54_9ACTN|nr:GntR family transcriptional regulator [Kribbella antibiotica]TDD60263.1 GntR family transcriptional regulator [Kribbella antibiotica]
MRRRSGFASRLLRTGGVGETTSLEGDLRRSILIGDQQPGTPIPIDEVAAFFGVSPIPVREALKTLLAEGLVEHRPHVGYSVAKLTFSEFKELYDVRQALESAALRAAAVLAEPGHEEQVRAAHAQLGEAVERGDERAYDTAARAFHLALIVPSGMQRLVKMYESVWNITEPARPMSRVPDDDRAALHADHERMLIAFTNRDADALVAESDRHYARLRTAISRFADDPDRFSYI